jgi:hypothetical protein
MRLLVFVGFLAVLASCSKSEDSHQHDEAAADTPYVRDIDRICHAEEHSGALKEEPGARPMMVALWLAKNMESEEGRTFAAKISQGSPDEKVALLKAEADKAKIKDCALIEAWSGGKE